VHGVAAADVRRWRAHRSYLTRAADNVATAAAAIPPLSASASAYLSMAARVDRFRTQALDELVLVDRALRPYPLWRMGPLLVPPDWIAPLEALHRFRAGSGARRSRVWRRREAAYADLSPRVKEALTAAPQTVAQLEEQVVLDSQAALASGGLGEWLADMAGRGDAVMGLSGTSLAAAEATFASTDSQDYIPPAAASSYEFLVDLALPYFRAAGPATRDDFVWWASISYSSARHTIEDLAGLLEEVDIEGERKAHFLTEDDGADLRRRPMISSSRAALLPALDPVRMATEAGFAALCDPRLVPRAAPPGRRGPNGPTGGTRPLLVGGAVLGRWEWNAKERRVETTLFKEMDERQQGEIGTAAQLLAELMESISKVAVGRRFKS
jgi:hypothetical protein